MDADNNNLNTDRVSEDGRWQEEAVEENGQTLETGDREGEHHQQHQQQEDENEVQQGQSEGQVEDADEDNVEVEKNEKRDDESAVEAPEAEVEANEDREEQHEELNEEEPPVVKSGEDTAQRVEGRSDTKRFPNGSAVNEHATEDELYSHMSTNVQVADVDALRQAIADVRSDANGVTRKSWVVAGHVDNNPNLVEVKAQDASEEANLEDFRKLLEDDQVMYALVRTTTTLDMSDTVRFVYVHWIGEQVPFVKRGRYGVVHGSVEDYFSPYHVVVETGNRDELTEEELVKLLCEKSMTASKVVDTPVERRYERGAPQAHQKPKSSSMHPINMAVTSSQLEVTPQLHEAIGEVRNDSSDVTWLLAEFEDNNVKKPLVVVHKGSGGVEAMKEYINNERAQFGLLRTSDTYDDIQTVKFVYIYWIGEDVKPMIKGKVYANAGALQQIFSPIHVSLSFTNLEEITEEIIKDKVSSSSGSKSFVK